MQRNVVPFVFLSALAIGIAFLSFTQTSGAQVEPPPSTANSTDSRFKDVKEEWSTPALSTSTLKPVQPIALPQADFPTYTVEHLQVQWRFGDPIDLYVMKPKGVKKPPVILYLYGYPSDTDRFNDGTFQTNVTKEGCAAVGFVSALTGPRHHDRPPKEWFVSELQESLATSAHDVQMVLNYLDTRADLDMNRVGMYTEGSGASIGILTSAVDPRIKVLEVVSPWGDWPAWMARSIVVPENERAEYVKPEFLKRVATLDPLEWVPKVQAPKFRLLDALFDLQTPRPSKKKLWAAVPERTTGRTYATPDQLKIAMQKENVLEWIQHELGSLPETGGASTASLKKQ
jgi:hypothetical protein